MKEKPSPHFNQSFITKILVPVLLVVILIGLLAVLVVIALTLFGLTPGA